VCEVVDAQRLKVFVVAEEDPRSELGRLLKQQHKTRQDELYGGLSRDERAEYDAGAERIDELKNFRPCPDCILKSVRQSKMHCAVYAFWKARFTAEHKRLAVEKSLENVRSISAAIERLKDSPEPD
jgi:hypothetical protein